MKLYYVFFSRGIKSMIRRRIVSGREEVKDGKGVEE
jgi:hypothetical protein